MRLTATRALTAGLLMVLSGGALGQTQGGAGTGSSVAPGGQATQGQTGQAQTGQTQTGGQQAQQGGQIQQQGNQVSLPTQELLRRQRLQEQLQQQQLQQQQPRVTRGVGSLEAQAAARRQQQQSGPQGALGVGTGIPGRQTIGGARSQGGRALRTVPDGPDFSRPQTGPGAQLRTNVPPQVTQDFLTRLTPEERFVVLQDLGFIGGGGDFDGSGEVRMPASRLQRLLGPDPQLTEEEQMQMQAALNRIYGIEDFSGPGFAPGGEWFSTMQRLEMLEERMLQNNDALLERLGQARQLGPERQLAAMGEIMQQTLLEHERMITYLSELRSALQEQTDQTGSYGRTDSGRRDLAAGPRTRATEFGVGEGGRRGFVQPRQFSWELEDEATIRGWEDRRQGNRRILGSDEWRDWQEFRSEPRRR